MGIALMVLGWLCVALGIVVTVASLGSASGLTGLVAFEAGAGIIGFGLILVGIGAAVHGIARNAERLDAIVELLQKSAQAEPPKPARAASPHDTDRRDLNW